MSRGIHFRYRLLNIDGYGLHLLSTENTLKTLPPYMCSHQVPATEQDRRYITPVMKAYTVQIHHSS